MGEKNEIFVTVGIDRKLVFWRAIEDTPFYTFFWNNLCLSGKITTICNTKLENNIFYMGGADSTIRAWDYLKASNNYF